MKILCICHANICRSLLAQEFLKSFLPGHTIMSRGLYADPEYEVPQKVKDALAKKHLPFHGHTSTQLSAHDLQQADLIFCVEKQHEDYLLDRYAQYTDKIWLLTDFAFGKPKDLTDPMFLEGRCFEKQAARIYEACQTAALRIQNDFLVH